MYFSEPIKKLISQRFQANQAEIKLHNFQIWQDYLQFIERENDQNTILLIHYYLGFANKVQLMNHSFDLLLDYAQSSLQDLDFALEEKIPEDIWLNFLAWFQVNNEESKKTRSFFRQQLKPIIQGKKDIESKALAINNWCASQVSYSASDPRTLDPKALYTKTIGRCGEESTFLVSVLRACGIPARQIYVPLWSHCDDNHAWVEIWTKEGFKFIGACEADIYLNRGWFIPASSRASFLIVRAVFPTQGEENIITNEGKCLINRSQFYCQSKEVEIEVLKDQVAVAGAKIQVQGLNYAHLRDFFITTSDQEGKFKFSSNYNDLFIFVTKDDLYTSYFLPAQSTGKVQIQLGQNQSLDQELKFETVAAKSKFSRAYSPEEKAELSKLSQACFTALAKRRRSEEIEDLLQQKLESILTDLQFPQFIHLDKGQITEKLKAQIRYSGLRVFAWLELLCQLKEKEGQKKDSNIKEMILVKALVLILALSAKDLVDISPEIFKQSYLLAPNFATVLDRYPEALDPSTLFSRLELWKTLYSPRQKYEPLSLSQELAYQSEGPEELLAEVKASYLKNLQKASSELNFSTLKINQIQSNLARSHSLSVFDISQVAVKALRSKLIPAGIQEQLPSAWYYEAGKIIDLEPMFFASNKKEIPEEKFLLKLEDLDLADYRQKWSLAQLSSNSYTLLGKAEINQASLIEGQGNSLALKPGSYRYLYCKRLANGNQLAKVEDFNLEADSLIKRYSFDVSAKDMLSSIDLEAISSYLPSLAAKTSLLIWLDSQSEPSIHVLNELRAALSEIQALDLDVYLLYSSSDSNFFANCQSYLDEFTDFKVQENEPEEQVARNLFINHEISPWLALIDSNKKCRYASSGYQVGVIELSLDIIRFLGRQN